LSDKPDEEDMPPDIQTGAVNLMTVHKSKGKEFLFVVYFNLSSTGAGNIETNLSEERRVAYVGVTRAQQGLLITADEDHYSHFLVELALDPEFDNFALPYVERHVHIVRKKRDKITHTLAAWHNKQKAYSQPSHFSWWPRRISPEKLEKLSFKITELEKVSMKWKIG
jgi:superfamily I DNA/RNA helicase